MKCMNSIYKSLLVLGLAMLPSAALALEPVMTGYKKTDNVLISSSSQWTNLAHTYATIPPGSIYRCAVTCTSTVNVPVDADSSNEYYYGASNLLGPNLNPLEGCVREFSTPRRDSVAGTTIKKMSITSTCFVPTVSGTTGFYCQGRKQSSGTLSIDVDDSSMQVICTDN